ncbi:peptidoglycan-binding domain-containing protein [Sphaerothrix gracilis]|uniref:peptidoglycan-binding domain-containing protein n=1 Tax=Sphaerothrix gracilis TaxID=3151835 RepID=UPI0031FBCAEE
MKSSKALAAAAVQYRATIETYCQIAVRPELSEAEADQLSAILEQAQTDSSLSFLLDEVDHLLAHRHNLIDEKQIRLQQLRLQAKIEGEWLEELLLDVQTSSRLEREALQQYLRAKGVYAGSIDGICGPQTQAAIKALSSETADALSPSLFKALTSERQAMS